MWLPPQSSRPHDDDPGVAQALEVGVAAERGIDARVATAMSWISFGRRAIAIDLERVQHLPRSAGSPVLLVAASLADPPAESPSTRNTSPRDASSDSQSVSLPAAPPRPEPFSSSQTLLRRLHPARSACWIASSAMRLPIHVGIQPEPRAGHGSPGESIFSAMRLSASLEPCPWNCGSGCARRGKCSLAATVLRLQARATRQQVWCRRGLRV